MLRNKDRVSSAERLKPLKTKINLHYIYIYILHSSYVAEDTACPHKGGYTLVTSPRVITPYRDSVDGTRDRVTYQKVVTR